jgi:hypothetical protein
MTLWGYRPHGEAVAESRKYWQYAYDEAAAALAAIDAGQVRVFHQLGPWAARNRREVNP